MAINYFTRQSKNCPLTNKLNITRKVHKKQIIYTLAVNFSDEKHLSNTEKVTVKQFSICSWFYIRIL